MIAREERDSAFDQIHYRIIDTLISWLTNEKRNLEGFIAHPEGHVDYSPYIIIDFDSLNLRVIQLGQVIQALQVIYTYKKGFTDIVTRSMHDTAVDHTPNIIWGRMQAWADNRANEMKEFLIDKSSEPPVPLDDYRSAVTFDVEKFSEEMSMYRLAADSLAIAMQFAVEQGLST